MRTNRVILCAALVIVAWCGLLTWWTFRSPAPLKEIRWPIKNAAWIQKYGAGPESQMFWDIFILGEITKKHAKRLSDLEQSEPNAAN